MENLLFEIAVTARDDGDNNEGKTTRDWKGEHHPFENEG